ncbi:hypothetical protein [Anaerococcus prevotii]|uniref:Conserved domain protein n=1 Tax=Anaerococcus prevotii ACS-065-V-Col13 TaxID=879305 RepID=F0GU07_9FIRM|nr:hypothetical protein [Anaerococcus prevotii]EGC82694.1 conserved domain protein [Anaerococcus prevotii ACS-065-V-Col13]
MKKSKIAAGVLLLAMGLTPVNSGLSYADDIEDVQVETSVEEKDANKELDGELIKNTNEELDTETKDVTDDDKNTSKTEDELEISDPISEDNQQAYANENVFSIDEYIDEKVKEIETTKLYKIASDDEIKTFDEAIEKLKAEYEDQGEDKTAELDEKIEKAQADLGHTVVFAKPVRTRLRVLSKIADNKLAKEKNNELDKANNKAKELIYSKNSNLDDLYKACENLVKLVGTYTLDESSLNEIYNKGGYSSDLLETFTEKDYKRGLDELELEKEAYLEDSKRYSEDSLKQLEEGEQLVTDQAKIVKAYKKALEELKNAEGLDDINEKINALTQPAYDMDNMVVQYNNKVKEKAESEEKLQKDIEKALDDADFKENEAYKRTSSENKDKYKKAYNKLKENKTSENLKALNDIKEEIKTNTFSVKLAELRSAIENPENKSVSDSKFKEIKQEYLDMLDEIEADETKTLDDLKDFEDEQLPKYYDRINQTSKQTPRKQKRKVVTKKSKGKVRTGVESILPIAGGVAVVAAIALFLTRKKK